MRHGIDYGIDPADFPSPAELAEMEEAWRARDDDTDTDTDFAPAAPPAPGGPPREGSGGTPYTAEDYRLDTIQELRK